VIDEAHHVIVGQQVRNRTGDFITTWLEKGGSVLYLTAFATRGSGIPPFPQEVQRYTRTIAEHSKGGVYSPPIFKMHNVPLDYQATTLKQMKGEDTPEVNVEAACQIILDRYIADGKPKTIINFPSQTAKAFIACLDNMFKKQLPATNVMNVHGLDLDKEEFARTLETERALNTGENPRGYRSSGVDVFLACKRFEEGTDWPLCSHVYNYGIPYNFANILQRWGRAMRKKYAPDYPEKYRNTATLTFFTPSISAAAHQKYQERHRGMAFLLAGMLHETEAAHQYRECISWVPAHKVKTAKEQEALVVVQCALAHAPEDTAKAHAIVAATKRQHRETHGRLPTAMEIQEHLTARFDIPTHVMDAVTYVLLGETQDPEMVSKISDEVSKCIRKPRLFRQPLVRKEFRDLFNRLLKEHGDKVLPLRESTTLALFRGDIAETIGTVLKDNLPKKALTKEASGKARFLYSKAHPGASVPKRSDSAAPYLGGLEYPWSALEDKLREIS